MNRNSKMPALISGCLLVAVTAPASPSFGANTLPVKPGVYVNAETTCSNAGMATLQYINGKTLNYGHGYCTIVSLKQTGNDYAFKAKCVNPDDTKENWSGLFTVDSPTRLRLNGQAMRWCFRDLNAWMNSR